MPPPIHISRLGWCVIAAALALPWGLVGWLLLNPSRPAPTAPSPAPAAAARPPGTATAKTDLQRGRVGPWGQLAATRILIEPPEAFIPPYYVTPQPPTWIFKGYTPAMLDTLWRDAALSPAQIAALNEPRRRTAERDAIVVRPDADTILSLTPEARRKIYTVLAAFPENVAQRDPFRSRADAVDDWIDTDVLPPDLVALTKRLLYQREGNVFFSDHDMLLPRLSTSRERVLFIKTLSRKSALMVELLIPPGANIDSLVQYWGSGRRSKDIGPLLESIAQRPQGGAIDIVHLLPPFARVLLYTYPVPSDRPSDSLRDCHWTSLNFFRDSPDERFTNTEFVQQTLLNDYYQTGGEPALGDIVMLVESGGRGVHSCVYVADDIVFTKNGAAFSVPWVLARLENVVAFYSVTEPVEIRRYRRKQT